MVQPITGIERCDVEQAKRGIQSVEVGGQLLLAMAEQAKPMMLRDIAALASLPPAKAIRIL